MFRYAPQSRVFWPITLASRDPTSGELVEGKAFILYELLDRDALKGRESRLTKTLMSGLTASASATKAPTAEDVQRLSDEVENLTKEHDEELVARIHGWKEFTGEDDKDLPFDRATLRAMMRDPLLYDALARGLIDASKGAKAKNSSPGPAGAPARGQK